MHCYIKENCLDRDILKSIKSKVDYFIMERINLNPIRKLINGRLTSLEYDNNIGDVEYLSDYSTLEQDTPSVRIKDPLLNIPELIDVVFNSVIYNQVTTDFKTTPSIEYIKIVKHFPNKHTNMVNDWHYDNFGKKGTRVVIIYLDDIQNIEEGPYTIIENSDINAGLNPDRNVFDDTTVEKFYGKDYSKHFFTNVGDVIFSKGDILHRSTKPITKERTSIVINFEANIPFNRTIDKIKLKRLDWYNIQFGKKKLAYNMEIV